MSWVVHEVRYLSDRYPEIREEPVDYVFNEDFMLLQHLASRRRLDDVAKDMLGEVLTPETFLEFMESSTKTLPNLRQELWDDIADNMIRRGMGPVEGQDFRCGDVVLAEWQDEEVD